MGCGASTARVAPDDDFERRQRPSMTEMSQEAIDDLQLDGGRYTFEPYAGPRTLKGTGKHILAGVRIAEQSGTGFAADVSKEIDAVSKARPLTHGFGWLHCNQCRLQDKA